MSNANTDNTLERQHCLETSIIELDFVNAQLSQLIVKKEQLTDEIISALGHNHEGQKTYEYDVWKIEVKTPCTYSLNKKLYESGKYQLPASYNPIKESISYSIDKRLCDKFLNDAPQEIRGTLAQLIDKKPAKASVVIKELAA